MNTFFTELAKSMADGQIIDMRIAKAGEELTMMVTTKGKKNLNITGLPEEVDAKLLGHIITVPERTKGLKATTTEPKDEDDQSEDDPDGKADTASTSSAGKKATPKKTAATNPDKGKKLVTKAGAEDITSKAAGTNTAPSNTPEPAKADNVVDAKAEAARIDNEFKVMMHEGKKLFAERKYQESLDQFLKAKALKPADAEAIGEVNKAEKWVKMVAEL